MFKVKVDDDIIGFAKGLTERTNYGRRGQFDGTPEQQKVGMIGQIVIGDMFGVDRPMPVQTSNGDGGIDFTYNGRSVDVKTMGRTVDPQMRYVNNLTELQILYKVNLYIFASFNSTTNFLTVCGWMPKKDIPTRATYHPAGVDRTRDNGTTFKPNAGLYEVCNTALEQVNTKDELINNIGKWV